jgi:ribonucleotide reductase alpha subunit
MQTNNAPHWMTEEAITILNKGYLMPGESPNDMYIRLAKTAALWLNRPELEAEFVTIFMNGWLSPATPVACNFGANNGALPVSCFSIQVPNSINEIFLAVREAALLSKHGGGLGIDMSAINGPTKVKDWAKFFDSVGSIVSQGGARRGAVALYLDFSHPDLMELLNARDLVNGDPREKLDCNIAVKMTNNDLKLVKSKDPEAIELFNKILELRMKTGSPYLQFMDNCWDADPDCYKANSLQSGSSNLCLLGDELVVTIEGSLPIKDLVGKNVTIFDGYKWVENNRFRQIGFDTKFVQIILESGTKLITTYDHKIVLNDKITRVSAKDIKYGDKIWTSELNNSVKYINYLEFHYPEPVYCTTVPSTNAFLLSNGMVTGNCAEIYLHHDKLHTYACVLSSLNAERYKEWETWVSQSGYSVPYLATLFLEAVCEEFIQKAKIIPGLEKAARGAIKGRPLGLGVLGLHGLYQSENLAWESKEASQLNKELFAFINKESLLASQDLATLLGEPEWCKGFGIRNTHRLAMAPTLTNSVICSASSPGIEPSVANYFVAEGAKGSFVRQNKYLKQLLIELDKDNGYIWSSIRDNQGSVSHLSFLTQEQKNVFKTAFEIDQVSILEQAADRQRFIDQGQSVNLFLKYNEFAKTIIDLHFKAAELGLKGLYYVRSTAPTNQKLKSLDFVYLKTRQNCIWCQRAKELLTDLKINYTEETKLTGQVPEIWVSGEKLDNGYESLVKLLGSQAGSIVEAKSDCRACEG